MPRIPRDLNGLELCRLLKKFNYQIIRQTGSHIRLTSFYNQSEHHITIPAHDPIKIGTLNKIFADISAYLNITKDELIHQLFGS